MKRELICVVSLRTKSEEKLPLANILLFLSVEIACSYDLFNMTALFGENPKRRTPAHRRANTPMSQNIGKVMIPATGLTLAK